MIVFESDRDRSDGELYYNRHITDLKSRLHLHNSFELVCVEQGTLTLVLGERRYEVNAGQGVLIFPNQVHGYEGTAPSRSYVGVFSASLVGEFAKKTQKTQPVSPLFDISGLALGARLSSGAKNRYLLKSVLYEMLYRFEQTAVYTPRTARGTELLGSILAFLAEHYKEPITMQTVARELGYDHRYLTNLVQGGLHTTFRKLLNEYRIENAKHLLQSTAAPVEQIAGECGYEALCSFNRNFKEITGTTPSCFRNGKA